MLKKIRMALTHSTPLPFVGAESKASLVKPATQELELEFAEQFKRLLGKFIFCVNEQECAAQLLALSSQLGWESIYCTEQNLTTRLAPHGFSRFVQTGLAACDVAITSCELLVARTGSIVMSSAQQSGRTASVYAPVHVCIAYSSQLVYDIRDGLLLLRKKYQGQWPSLVTFATGPSRTADIEKTLVVGVHGPKEVYLFLVDEQS